MGTNSYRKICPICSTSNEPNAIICRHCGAHIELRPNIATTILADPSFEFAKDIKGQVDQEYRPPSRGVSLFLLNQGDPITLRTEEEFVLGRAGEAAAGAMVDLSEYDGFGMGISRRHALIRAVGEKYVLVDLNSANGTWLNGQRLLPNKPVDLPSGAVFQLGRLILIASYLHPPTAKN